MSNMSYCRFQNTLSDLQDCDEHLSDVDLSKEEHNARQQLIELCLCIVEEDANGMVPPTITDRPLIELSKRK